MRIATVYSNNWVRCELEELGDSFCSMDLGVCVEIDGIFGIIVISFSLYMTIV